MTAYERYLKWSPKWSKRNGHAPSEELTHQPRTLAERAAFVMFEIMDENGVGLGGDKHEQMDGVIGRMAYVLV